MERELWPLLYRLIRETAKDFHQKHVRYQPWLLVTVFLWAALHDRPICWACQRRHWSTTTLRPFTVPSPSTMSRRIDSVSVGLFWLENALRETLFRAALACDGSYMRNRVSRRPFPNRVWEPENIK